MSENSKVKVVASFSGGETSAYMSIRLKEKYGDEVAFMFANTGQENEETLAFVNNVDKEFDLGVVWIETVVHHEKGVGSTYKVVDYETASRNGVPYEDMIKKYGLPNRLRRLCTRELKAVPLQKYQKKNFPNALGAIGIRCDEIDRVSVNYKELGLVYPLAFWWPTNKNEINRYWRDHSYRLDLKHYQGNCKWCYKKSYKKLAWIMNETPEAFDFPERMEKEYGDNGKSTIFRDGKTVSDIREMSRIAVEPVDDARVYFLNNDLFGYDDDLDVCGSESCEPF